MEHHGPIVISGETVQPRPALLPSREFWANSWHPEQSMHQSEGANSNPPRLGPPAWIQVYFLFILFYKAEAQSLSRGPKGLPFQGSDARPQRPSEAWDLAGHLILFSSECTATQVWRAGRAAGSVAWALTEISARLPWGTSERA